MSENKDTTKKKKILSLKLGTKHLIAPKKNIEAGKTVIVEKKRYKRGPTSDTQSPKTNIKDTSPVKTEVVNINEKDGSKRKSSVVLKPLSKDEQKRILKADTKKDKKDEIDKIRSGKSQNPSNLQNDTATIADTNIKLNNLENRDIKRETEKKKNSDTAHEIDDRKKSQNTFGRKKIRERKVTIVTALSDIDERTRSLAAYKRSKQKTKKK